MHDTFFFIRQLSKELGEVLPDKRLVECFSQSKDELVMGFANQKSEFWLKAAFLPQFCLISFPNGFQRAKKNTIDLLTELIDKSIVKVGQFEFERAFWIEFSNGYQLIFKMFGNKSNLILCQNKIPVLLFRKKFVQDLKIEWEKLHRKKEDKPFSLSSLLSRQIREYTLANPEHHIEELVEFPKTYFITKTPQLWLFKPVNQFIEVEVDKAIEAGNLFYELYIRTYQFNELKTQSLQRLNTQIGRSQSYLKEGYDRLFELKQQNPHEKAADLLMAYLHLVKEGQKEVELADFETGNVIKIKLNEKLSAQKNAENLYRKAKNRRLEIENLERGIAVKTEKLVQWQHHLHQLQQIQDFFSLNRYVKTQLNTLKKEETESQPYRSTTFLGFKIQVGKNAKYNDQMLKSASKDDLWLHVRDAKGSHVLVKQVPGKPFPKLVIERAAEIAAFYSERRHDSLCAVIYTPKKFIRKRKGAAPGEVIVDKEQVVLVWPKGIDDE